MNLPTNIQTQEASLPDSYERAKNALAECASKDECMQWADKARALASYAKQSQDETLHNFAKRIRARAIRRAGELLKQIEPAKNQHDARAKDGGVPSTRTQAATDAGMSERQRKEALRVANVPADEFEKQVESETPPTTSQLSEQGIKKRTKREFDAATYAISTLERFVEEARRFDPESVAKGLMCSEVQHAQKLVAEADAWLDRLIVNLETDND